ncbi:hypothetical protein ABW20_dc0107008 [Dactylellina cionopaga]|nr:hypothetical protein ABW20_dc0107008 [Dactylellina cionopaga]
MILPKVDSPEVQSADMYQTATLCIGATYTVSYKAKIQSPNARLATCDFLVLVPGQRRWEKLTLIPFDWGVEEYEFHSGSFEFTADQGVVSVNNSPGWYDIATSDGASGTFNIAFRFSCPYGSLSDDENTLVGKYRVSEFHIYPL